MRKKFLGAFLLGVFAIATTSTFVSCKDKDYDDDIIALQNKDKAIDALIAEKVAACEAAIEGLKQADKDLDAAIKDGDAATLAAAKAAVATAQSTLEAALAAAQNKHDQDLAALDAKLSAAIAKAQGAAEAAQATADKNTTAIAKVASDLAAVEKSLDARLVAAEKQLGTLEAALKAQEAALEQEKKDRASGDAANLEKINKLISDIATLQKNLEQADRDLRNTLDKLAEDVENDIKAINEKLATAESDAKKVADRVKEVEDRLDVITGILSKSLRSLVFMPYVYVDGIEAITYPEITIEDYLTTIGYNGETFSRPVRFQETIDPQDAPSLKIPAGWDYRVSTVTPASPYYPEIGVDYHMNPSTAVVAWEDIKGFIQRDTRYTTTTRALTHQDDMDGLVVAAKTNAKSGYQHFGTKGDTLSVGIKVASATAFNKLWNDDRTDNNNYIAALQVKNGGEDNYVTSDYALIYPEKVSDLKIAWGKENERVDAAGNQPDPWDVAAACPKHHQIFDNPKAALLASASIYVPYNGSTDISKYIETCFRRVGAYGGSDEYSSWKFEDTKKYGFTYEFRLVPYEHVKNINNGGGTNTGAVVEKDHEYADIDLTTGVITAHAKGDKNNISKNSIGREPLVQVILKYGNEVIEDAYILCRITADVDAQKDFGYAEWEKKYDNCHGLTFTTPVGKENDFKNLIMAAGGLLNGEFDFLTFNGLYELEGGVYTRDALGIPTTIVTETIFKGNDLDADADDACKHSDPDKYTYKDRGGVSHYGGKFTLTVHPSTGTKTGYTFKLDLTAAQVEALTHDANSYKVTKDLYLRWNAKSRRAPYNHIYMKFTVTIIREIERSAYADELKLDNYWYGLDGAKTGWDAILYNPVYPQDGLTVENPWNSSILKSFKLNDIAWSNSALPSWKADNTRTKFFFVPQNTIIRVFTNVAADPQKYEDWVITPASGDDDVAWRNLYCEKDVEHTNAHVWPLIPNTTITANGVDVRAYNTASGKFNTNDASLTLLGENNGSTICLDSLMRWCNIAYNKGAFTNKVLYAVRLKDYHNGDPLYHGTYTKIATLNQATGEMDLYRTWTGNTIKDTDNDPTDLLYNAIGYAENNANISKQLHAWVSTVAANTCDVAVFSFDGYKDTTHKNFTIWEASWERAITLKKIEKAPEIIKDAQNNGGYIAIYDLLKFYDWRGPDEGNMETLENKWLWAFYNINRIELDLNANNVTTDLDGGQLGKTALSKFSGTVNLFPATAAQHSALKPAAKFSFPTLIAGYNSSNSSADLVDYLEGTQNGKANFGYIFYENNGLNVTKFTVRIPVTIYYGWGHIKDYIDVPIDTTLGH